MKKIIYIAFIAFSIQTNLSQWVISYTPSTGQSTYAIKFYNNMTGYMGSALYGGSTFNLYKTTNGGMNWTAQNSYRSGTRISKFYIFHPDTAFCCGNFGLILKTVSGGAVWDSAGLGNYTNLYGIDFINNNTGFVVGDAGVIWKTTNKGSNWSIVNAGIVSSLSGIKFVNQTTGYIIAAANFMYKSTDGGVTWVNLNFPHIPPFDFLRDLTFTDDNTGYVTGDIGRMRKTTNGGLNWVMQTTPHTEPIFGIDKVNANILFASCGAGKVIRTSDAGTTWTLQQTPLNEFLFAIDMQGTDTGYISTWSGKVLKTINGGLTAITPISTIAEEYKLEQNYPNPFNPFTLIRFQILSPGFTELKIFDMLGREITKLISENLRQGAYEIEWDASSYPSGAYFYKLSAGNYTKTRKMVLVK